MALPVAERFCAIGLRCIIPDLPAHGDSPVQASRFGLDEWEKHLPKNVLDECANHLGFNAQPCALWGISMGGSFATSAASADKRWIEVDGGTHSKVLTTPMPLYSMMADWILEHMSADTSTPLGAAKHMPPRITNCDF